MTYPYGTKGAPAVGGGLPGLPRRMKSSGEESGPDIKVGDTVVTEYPIHSPRFVRNGMLSIADYPRLAEITDFEPDTSVINQSALFSNLLSIASARDGTSFYVVGNALNAPSYILRFAGENISADAVDRWVSSGSPVDIDTTEDGKYILTIASGGIVAGVFQKGESGTKLELVQTLDGPGTSATRGAFSPDGRFIATIRGGNLITYFGEDGHWTHTQDPDSQPSGTPNSVKFSRDGRFLVVTSSSSPYFSVYNVSSEGFTMIPSTLTSTQRPSAAATGADFSLDGSFLVVVSQGSSRTINTYAITEASITYMGRPAGYVDGINSDVAFSPDGKLCVTVGETAGQRLRVFRVDGMTLTLMFASSTGNPGRRVVFSDDGGWVFITTNSAVSNLFSLYVGQFYEDPKFVPTPIRSITGTLPAYNYVRFR